MGCGCVAKQVSAGDATGQLASLNMNAVRVYRKLRRRGLPHRPALAMAKRARRVKMAKDSHVPGTPYRFRHGWVPLSWGDAQASVQAAKKAHPDPYGRIPREAEVASLTTDHQRFFFHSAPSEHRDSIAATGLEASRSRGGRNTRVYLDSQESPPKRRSDTGPRDYYRVDTQGVPLRPDPELPGRWAISETDFAPERVKLIATTHPDGLAKSYNPRQQRVPKGQPGGGQFGAEGKQRQAAAFRRLATAGRSGSAVTPAQQRALQILTRELRTVDQEIAKVRAEAAKLPKSAATVHASRSAGAKKAAATRKAKGTKKGGTKGSTKGSSKSSVSPAQRKAAALASQLAGPLKRRAAIQRAINAISHGTVAKAAPTFRRCAVCGKPISLDRRVCSPAHAQVMRDRMAKAAHAPYAALHPPIPHSAGVNWVDKVGGLPGPIDAIYRVLVPLFGGDKQRAAATAVSTAEKQCETGRAFGGKVKLSGPAHAVICAAVAEWHAKRAAA